MQGETQVAENQPTICPLMVTMGNCLFRSTCTFPHPEDAIIKTTEEIKQRKALKLNKAPFQPTPAPKVEAKDQLKTTSTEFVPGGTEDTQKQPGAGKIKTASHEFFPGAVAEELKYEDIAPEDAFGEYEDEDDENQNWTEETKDAYHPNSKDCECCKGLIYMCDGIICQTLGYCHCYATEIEEKKYNDKRSKK